MARPSKRERATADRLHHRYAETWGNIGKAMALEVFGANIDVNGYTTVAQAERLARGLRLKPEMRVLDVGAGAGWPGLHVAKTTGCGVVLADQPRPALLRAARHTQRDRLGRRVDIVQMTATALPFRPGTFDAIVHTDVMC